MATHRDLKVWQLAQQLAAGVYELTRGAAAAQMPNLVEQIRRSALSIGANIAEGRALGSNAQFKRHLSIALGSAAETDSHLDALLSAGVVDALQALELRDSTATIQRMLIALQRKIG
ncbi:four helix bundle protein [Gemmatimonas sp. UBA7669]|uniref:four helix bundle protein n=1 Tax=Gemmatimonas sp. UBA7669 TaxID=1946568 RepID=UPI0025C55D4C|nr:four helix bundle protein [Gemmatimonas sp. UBA7669]